MIRIYKHITFFLLGLFLFPIVYQPIHSYWHHSVKNSQTKQIHCNHSCCSPLQTTTHNYSKGLNRIETLNGKEEHCPICEYQLSINNLLVISTFEYLVQKLDISYNEIVITQFIPSVASKESPRAPPINRA